jgi:hypothetical protein
MLSLVRGTQFSFYSEGFVPVYRFKPRYFDSFDHAVGEKIIAKALRRRNFFLASETCDKVAEDTLSDASSAANFKISAFVASRNA